MPKEKTLLLRYTPGSGLKPPNLDVNAQGFTGEEELLHVLRSAIAAVEQHRNNPQPNAAPSIVTVPKMRVPVTHRRE